MDTDRTSLIIHVGQELQARSGGRWPATVHRVCNPVGGERSRARLSFAFFVS
ncbi:2OG-Fe(II) oxygenase family protein [Frankia tisae]|uniref:2OG-Fe(II) oxygenase family protein n=1 Tax=Frankia tisae TaxID=2950104 RepID=UPI0034D67FA8